MIFKSSLFETIRQFISEQGVERNYWIAFSGGLDSQVLLHLFAEVRSVLPLSLRVIHVNHGLNSQADKWVLQCEQRCRELNINFITKKISIQLNKGESLENAAREVRYAVFSEFIKDDDIIVTAHHQDDQAETLLLQLLRGAGLKGLAAMPMIKPFAKGFLARPLLNYTRDELKKYAEQNKLSWIEDDSNASQNFTRNFLRQEIFPLLKKRWPNVAEVFSRSALHCAEAQAMLDEIVEKELASIQGSQPNTLSVKKLLQQGLAQQKYLIRAWLGQQGFSLPATVKMKHILQDMLHAGADKQPMVAWPGVELRRYRDDLFAMLPLSDHDAGQVLVWDLKNPLSIQGVGILATKSVQGNGLNPALLKNVTVCFRQGGEVGGHHALKKYFQEWGVLPWMRDRVPLVFVDGELVAVPGRWVARKYAAAGHEGGVEFVIFKSS